MNDIVVVERLVKRFSDVVAVNGVSFRIKRNEVFALLGPNGAGKTTTIHVIATLLRPTSGRVAVAGFDVVESPEEVRKRIGVVFQDPSLDNQLTGYDNMYIHGKLYGLRGPELHERIAYLLELVDLRDFAHKKVAYYSSGMRRRLEIARSLIHEPDLLILDEPTIGLDPQSRARVWDYVRGLRKERGMTILMTTHYMDEAEELADRIAIMDRGEMLAMGSAEELKSILGQDVVYVSLDYRQVDGDPCSVLGFAGECKRLGEGRVELIVGNAAKALPEILSVASSRGLKVVEVSYRRPTLNEVFLHLTGRELRDSPETRHAPLRGPWRWAR